MQNDTPQTTLVLGGGPAGLTAGYLLRKTGREVVVFEAGGPVGGLAKTVEIDGYRFDLGGHRFFTKVTEVDELWHEILGDEFLRRPRMSRIYWNNRYLDYPLRGGDVIRKLGPIELARCMASYLRAAAKRGKVDESLEDWVTNRFGKRLYELFFKSYNEKVWGVPTSEIRAEWAAQRIKGLSFFSAAKAAFFGNKGNKVKSLISEFNYPRFGPGQMWDAMTAAITEQGGEVRLEAPVSRLELAGGRVVEVEAGGVSYTLPDAVISSLPLREVVEMVSPSAPQEVLDAARGLRYRDFLTVALVVDGKDLFPDNWIYIHEPGVRVGRIQNYRSWSPWMVPTRTRPASVSSTSASQATTSGRWTTTRWSRLRPRSSSTSGSRRSRRSSAALRFASRRPTRSTTATTPRVQVIRDWLDGIENLQQVGRNGLHRYNNSDHSMLTAMRAVDNLVAGAEHDIWAVNAESVYHETDVADEHPYRTAPETPEMQALAAARPE